MKYEQLIVGLIAGAAVGALVTTNGHIAAGGTPGRAGIEQIVRDVISKEPKLILDSVQKYQQEAHEKASEGASAALKDADLHHKIYDDANSAYAGPKDAPKVIVEYFDYKCPVCKMMYKSIDQLLKEHSDVKVIFKEFPIFGPVSDANTKLGFAIWHYYPEKYYAFYGKMLSTPGHGDDQDALKTVHALGMDIKKLQDYAATPEVEAMLQATREQGNKLAIQGTPTLIIGDEVIPHAMSYDELLKKIDAMKPDAAAAPEKIKKHGAASKSPDANASDDAAKAAE